MSTPQPTRRPATYADATNCAATFIFPAVGILAAFCRTANLMTDRLSLRIAQEAPAAAEGAARATSPGASPVLYHYHHQQRHAHPPPPPQRYLVQLQAIDGGKSTLMCLHCYCAALPLSSPAEDAQRDGQCATDGGPRPVSPPSIVDALSTACLSDGRCSLTADSAFLLETPIELGPRDPTYGIETTGPFLASRSLTVYLHPGHLLAALQIMERSGRDFPGGGGAQGDLSVRLIVSRDGATVCVDTLLMGPHRRVTLRALHDQGDPMRLVPWRTCGAAVGLPLPATRRLRQVLEGSAAHLQRTGVLRLTQDAEVELTVTAAPLLTVASPLPPGAADRKRQRDGADAADDGDARDASCLTVTIAGAPTPRPPPLHRDGQARQSELLASAPGSTASCTVALPHLASVLQVAEAVLAAIASTPTHHGHRPHGAEADDGDDAPPGHAAAACATVQAAIDNVPHTMGVTAVAAWARLEVVLLGLNPA